MPADAFPLPLAAYADDAVGSLVALLRGRIEADPLNAAATAIFLLAVLHTFVAVRITEVSHRVQRRRDAQTAAAGGPVRRSVRARLLHVLGEVEVVFVIWGIPLVTAIVLSRGWSTAARYLGEAVSYTEPMFVVVIMAMASTRPIVELAEGTVRRLAALGGATPAAWWITILVVGPLLGSLITEPGAMTISALLLARQFYDLRPPAALRYATLGLLFVNVSIGGTLTHFAAPPILMVARPWGWDTPFLLTHFGWRAAAAILASTALYYLVFRADFRSLTASAAVDRTPTEAVLRARGNPPAPWWVTLVYVLFMVWTVTNSHHPVSFLAGFVVLLIFARATGTLPVLSDLRTPLLVGLFLAGLVVHGGLQAWWIAPVLSRLGETPMFLGAMFLTAFNDNALITYLATLVPNLSDELKYAVVEGAVTGGGLTVIANAPNPAGQALLGRFFDDAVNPLYLFAGALLPTIVAAIAFRVIW